MRIFKICLAVCMVLLLLSGCVRNAAPEASQTQSAGEADTEAAQTPSEAPFTLEELQQANLMNKLIAQNGRVELTGYENGQLSSLACYFEYNGQIVSAQKILFEGDPYFAGTIGNRYYEQSGDRLRMDFNVSEEESEAYLYDYEIASLIMDGTIEELQEQDGAWSFRIQAPADSEYESAVCRCVADKQTLMLREATLTYDTGESYRYTMAYGAGQLPEDFSMMDSLEKPYRTVTMEVELHDAEGKPSSVTRTVDVPYNMEVRPTADKELNLYGDAAFTKPYAYPGDGTQAYTVWATDAMG